jgi:ATP-dependent Clp protease ATP-binding subunit ClpA
MFTPRTVSASLRNSRCSAWNTGRRSLLNREMRSISHLTNHRRNQFNTLPGKDHSNHFPSRRCFSQSPTRCANGPSPPRGGFPLENIFGQQPEPKAGDALKEFGIDLTEKAKKGELDPCIGRTEEIKRSIQILSRRTKVCMYEHSAPKVNCLLMLHF